LQSNHIHCIQVSYTGTSRLHGQHGIQCYSTSMQVPPTWPVALEGIPGVASSSWKPAETAFLQARKDGFTGVQTTSFKHTMKTYHNILDCCNFLSSQFHVCVCLVAQYIPNTPQGLQGVPAVWMVYWTWLARVT
jgi:hypothetical protein